MGLTGPLAAGDKTKGAGLNVLFLGGTGFIGPHMVQQCLDAGHKVTLFNRGKRNSELFADLETIIGNRDPNIDDGLKGLEGREWDVVIDTSGYIPRHVDASAKLLANAASHYLFISTVAVYEDFSIANMDETAPLIELDDPSVEQVTGETYGGLKVLCEQAVSKHFKENSTILRPTYIVGPGDHTDRFIHYINRPMEGGRMAMPGRPSNPVDYVDVRDLAAFVEHMASTMMPGVYNTVNVPKSVNFGQLMDLSVELSSSEVDITWLSSEFLNAQKELMGDQYRGFPMWHDQDGEAGSGSMSQARAVAAGFSNRPFKETVEATHKWWIEQPQERRDNRRKHISAEFEQALLAAWDARSQDET